MRLQFSFTFTYGALALWESATAPWNIYPERIYIYILMGFKICRNSSGKEDHG